MSASPPSSQPSSSQPDNFLVQIHESFYESGEYSDVTVRYGSGSNARERRLHKVVLCSQSEFFKTMLAMPMKEAHDGIVYLHEDPDLIDIALDHIYLHTLDARLPAVVPPADAAVRLLHIYEIANQYMVGTLQEAAAARFGELVRRKPSLSANAGVQRAAFEELTRDAHGVRRLIARAYIVWAPVMTAEVEAFLRRNPDAATDYLFEMASERYELGSRRVCWQCSYQVSICVTPLDPTVENRYDTPVRNADLLKDCPTCGKALQFKALGPVLEE